MSGGSSKALQDPWASFMEVYQATRATKLRPDQTTPTHLARKEKISYASAARLLENLEKSGHARSDYLTVTSEGTTRRMKVYTLTGVQRVHRPAGRDKRGRRVAD